MGIIQYGILNDIHFPEESPLYYKAIDEIARWPNLGGIYLNGDIGELDSVSGHPGFPGQNRNLIRDIAYINERFDDLQRRFDIPIFLIEGNHCYRIFRYIRDVAPEMWGLIDCPKLFKFEDRPNWKFIPYGPTQWCKVGKANLYARHEPLVGGSNHAKGSAEKSYVNMVYGHTHVYQSFTHKKMGPSPFLVTATSCGWLGDINKAAFDYRGPRDNWINGFTRIDCDEKTGDYELRFLTKF